MPARRPRASFEPIPADFNLPDFVEQNENFEFIDRITIDAILEQDPSLAALEKLVVQRLILEGKPLVIDGFDARLDPWIFTEKWLRDNHGDKEESARDITKQENLPLTIGHYLKNMPKLADQFFTTPDAHLDPKKQRVYLKDIDCPPVWHDKLKEHIPPFLFYWNDSTGEIGGPGAVNDKGRPGKGIAHAGDLMSMLPKGMRADNLMCYIGHEGTYTPAHREMCASLGQNIMVEASEQFDENGEPMKPGSSIWFMTERKDRDVVAEYWLSVLGHDIEVENHFAQLAAWRKAPFKVWVVEQRPGDFILVPPLAPHQVWNRGTRTMKVAWNRTTVETLEMAFEEALPKARLVCRDEQYKNKAIVYYSLINYSNLLKIANLHARRNPAQAGDIYMSKKVRQLQKDFKRLFKLFKDIMLSEMWAIDTRESCEFVAFDSNVTCSYCRGNIFNRFLTCKHCAHMFSSEQEDPYDVCMECYTMGRSCACRSNYKWVEQFKWKDLLSRYEEWRQQVIQIDPRDPLLPLLEEWQRLEKRTLAEICQQQLKLRPFADPKKPKTQEPEEFSEEEVLVDEDGFIKKVKTKRSKGWLENNKTCHVCLTRHPKWMMASCTMCERSWCYGSLWRAHELLPRQVMEDPQWECPHCRKVCSTGKCRQDPRQKPYEPKHTMLGHDTKKVADIRSTEVLVDFSVSNLNWLKEKPDDQPHDSKRIRHQIVRAVRDKESIELLDGENYVDETEDAPASNIPDELHIHYDPIDPNLDPALLGDVQDGAPNPVAHQDGAQWNAVNLSNPSLDHWPARQSESVYPDLDMESNAGYIAPTAVMLAPAQGTGFPTASQVSEGSSTELGKRRREPDLEPIKLVSSKKRKVGEPAEAPQNLKNLNKASKQYQLAQNQKRLEEAAKQGRYLQVYASVYGRSKVVKLKVDGTALAEMAARAEAVRPSEVTSAGVPASNRTVTGSQTQSDVLLRSDVAPSTLAGASIDPSSKPKQYRFRVEEDEDFQLGGTEDQDLPLHQRKKKKPRTYEEISVDSDEDVIMPDVSSRSSRRQRPLYLQRRDADQDMPDALPANFKDGQLRTKRDKERDRERAKDRAQARRKQANVERRQTMPAALPSASDQVAKATRPPAMKAPRIRPAGLRASTGNMEVEDDEDSSTDAGNGANMTEPFNDINGTVAAATAQETARLALLEEENRQAKLAAAAMFNDLVDEFATDLVGEENIEEDARTGAELENMEGTANLAVKPTAPAVTAQKPKKLSPAELKKLGKTIKAAPASSKRTTSATVQTIGNESLNSDDEESSQNGIPAKAPGRGHSTTNARDTMKRAVGRASSGAAVVPANRPANAIWGKRRGRPPGRRSLQ